MLNIDWTYYSRYVGYFPDAFQTELIQCDFQWYLGVIFDLNLLEVTVV
jgi:hypothetical protein